MRRTTTLLTILFLTLSACSGDANTTSPTDGQTSITTNPPAATTSEATLGDPEAIEFVSGGNALEATVWPGGTTWVVLGHMLPADKSSWTGLAVDLQEAGFSVLAYNNRGFGNSEGSKEAFALYVDAAAAIAYAQRTGARKIVYGGASMNGANAIKLGVYYDFAAIFALSPVTSFPSAEKALDAAYDVYSPMLIVAAEDDPVAIADLDRFLDRFPGGGDWITLEQGGHGTDMLFQDPTLGQRIVDWIVAALAK